MELENDYESILAVNNLVNGHRIQMTTYYKGCMFISVQNALNMQI